jgi:CRISPR-associated endoribonuclease Cas2
MVRAKVKAKRIFCVVAYDIENDKNRTRVSKILAKYGVRVNYSVFECMFTESQFLKAEAGIMKLLNEKKDRVIFYPICVDCYTRIIYRPKMEKESNLIQII